MAVTWLNFKTFTVGNNVKLVHGGEDFFTNLEHVIRSAKEVLHIQIYRFDSDATGQRIIKVLLETAARGVKIFMVVDAYGASRLTEESELILENAGIQFRRFSPFKISKFFHLGRRLHHKIVLADGKLALVGGINVADPYRGTPTEPAWFDFAMLVEGPCCSDLERVCQDLWNRKLNLPKPILIRKKRFRNPVVGREHMIRVSENDWLRGKLNIAGVYRDLFLNAQERVIVVASYFLPGRQMRSWIKKAADRGVDVKLVLAGVADVPFAKSASNYLYQWLLKSNISIYEWNESILHGKAAVVDDWFTTLGSYNLNFLSHYGSIELNLDIYDENFSTEFSKILLNKIEVGANKVELEDFIKSKNIFGRIYDWGSYRFVRFSMYLLFLLTNKNKYRDNEMV